MKNYIPSKSSVAKNAKLEAPVRLCGACTVRDYSEIGQFTFVNDGTTFFRNTTVGRYCSIGKACEIGAPMHPVDWLTSSPVAFAAKRHFRNEDDIFPQSAFDQYKPTTIGSDVWIGSQCIISAGVTIGHGAIIGGGAVVTKDVAPYAIVGGTPAKLIRYRFDQETVARLLATQWWTLTPEEIAKLNLTDVAKSLHLLEAAGRT